MTVADLIIFIGLCVLMTWGFRAYRRAKQANAEGFYGTEVRLVRVGWWGTNWTSSANRWPGKGMSGIGLLCLFAANWLVGTLAQHVNNYYLNQEYITGTNQPTALGSILNWLLVIAWWVFILGWRFGKLEYEPISATAPSLTLPSVAVPADFDMAGAERDMQNAVQRGDGETYARLFALVDQYKKQHQ